MLKLIVAKLEDVDEPFRSLYEATSDGKFKLKVDGVEDAEELKAQLARANRESAERRREIERWKKSGKTPEEIEALIAAADEAEKQKLEKAGEWDKLREQMNKAHSETLAQRDAREKALLRSIERYLIDAAATAAIAGADGVPDLLLPHVQRHVKMVEKDGEFSVQVVDAKGDPRVNARGEPLQISDLVGEMRQSEVFGRAFKASGHSGGSVPPKPGAPGGSGTITSKKDFKSEKERAAYVDAHGIEAYQQLPNG